MVSVTINQTTALRPWHYRPAADLNQNTIERLRRFPREPDLLVDSARLASSLVMRSALRVFHRVGAP